MKKTIRLVFRIFHKEINTYKILWRQHHALCKYFYWSCPVVTKRAFSYLFLSVFPLWTAKRNGSKENSFYIFSTVFYIFQNISKNIKTFSIITVQKNEHKLLFAKSHNFIEQKMQYKGVLIVEWSLDSALNGEWNGRGAFRSVSDATKVFFPESPSAYSMKGANSNVNHFMGVSLISSSKVMHNHNFLISHKYLILFDYNI